MNDLVRPFLAGCSALALAFTFITGKSDPFVPERYEGALHDASHIPYLNHNIELFQYSDGTTLPTAAEEANPLTYLNEVKLELKKAWPENRTINLVYHGHSVPTGYFVTPHVETLKAYPFLTLGLLKSDFPNAVINTILTSIGGEQSEQGAARFSDEVLTHRPAVVFIDYALNDRRIGLERARAAWSAMIEQAIQYGAKVVLMTPTPDTEVAILTPDNVLEQHAQQIRRLGKEFGVAVVDSYARFKQLAESGNALTDYMAQNNHPNALGHQVVANEIVKWFR